MQKVKPTQQRSRNTKKFDKKKFFKTVLSVVKWLGKLFHLINYLTTELLKLWHHFF
jgi:hypothetical protein